MVGRLDIGAMHGSVDPSEGLRLTESAIKETHSVHRYETRRFLPSPHLYAGSEFAASRKYRSKCRDMYLSRPITSRRIPRPR